MKKIWWHMLSVFLIFFVTLLVFPGITSDVQYCQIGDWTIIIHISLYEFSNTIARVRKEEERERRYHNTQERTESLISNGVHILYSSVVCMKGHQSPSMHNIIDLFIYTQFLCLLPHSFGSKSLIFISILRFILIPLLVLCVTPSPTHPIFSPPFNLVVSFITVTVIGATNGYFGTIGMQQGPTMVPSVEKELAGETRIQHNGSPSLSSSHPQVVS